MKITLKRYPKKLDCLSSNLLSIENLIFVQKSNEPQKFYLWCSWGFDLSNDFLNSTSPRQGQIWSDQSSSALIRRSQPNRSKKMKISLILTFLAFNGTNSKISTEPIKLKSWGFKFETNVSLFREKFLLSKNSKHYK